MGDTPRQSRDVILGVQGYSAIECPMVGGTSQDSPGMPYLLWHTGILCHRVSYGGGGHPRTVQGCRTYYGVQGYSAIECPMVGGGHPRTVQGCHTYYGVQGYSAIECPMVGGTSQDSPGMPYLLWRTGILCHRVSYGGGGHPRTVQGCHTYYGVQGYSAIVQGCRTYYGVQGYSAIECPVVGGTSQDSPGMPYLLWRTGILCHRVSYGGGDIPGQSRDAVLTMAYRDTLP